MYTFVVEHIRALPHPEVMSLVSSYSLPRGGWNLHRELGVWITRLHTHYPLEMQAALRRAEDVVSFEQVD
jgi:hypothetical protein